MRYLLFIISLALVSQANAQFPGTDSLRNYNNRYVTTNPATAFTNNRLNTLIRGIIDWVDTARAGTGGGGALGIDTLWALNDSTIRYRKNGVFRNTILRGVYDTRRKVDTAYALNDSTLQIKINGTNRNIILPGRHWTLQGVLNNGSTLTENEVITLADSLTFTSGMVVISTLNLPSVTASVDTTTYKPLARNSTGDLRVMAGWPGSGSGGFSYIYSATAPTATDTAKIWIKTPAIMGVYDVWTYATYQFSWVRYAWLSIDGFLSFLPPLNMVFAGQSNAAGSYGGGDTARTRGILGFSSGAINSGIDDPTAWQPTWIGLSPFFNDNNNIAHAFAKEVIRKDRRIVRMIGAYLGGAGIGVWNGRTTGGTTPPYMLDTLRQRLARSGIDTVHVFLWGHGESAYPTPDSDGGYYSDFKCFEDSLYSPLTAGIHRNFTNIISCSMATDTSTTAVYTGASQQGGMRRLREDNDPYTNYATAQGLSLCDASHFCGPALDTLGRRAYAAWKEMPRSLVDEEPKFTYDYINNKKAFLTRIIQYANGITGTNFEGVNLSIINNTNPIFGIDGSSSIVNIGAALGFTSTVNKIFTVNGNAAISDGGYSLNIAGGFNHTGNPLRNVVLANYPTNFAGTAGGDDNVAIGYNPMFNPNRMLFNSVAIGSSAMEGFTPVGFGDYVVAIGKDALKNANCLKCSFVGPLSGGNSAAGQGARGDQIGACGYNSGPINNAVYFNASAYGPNAKYRGDGSFVAGNNLDSFVIGGLTTRYIFKVSTTPSNGEYFSWNNSNKQFELTTAPSGADGNGIYSGNGSLPSDVTVTGGANGITFTSTRTGTNSTVVVNNTSSGRGLSATSVSGLGFHGSSTDGIGILGISTNNTGIWAQATAAHALYAQSPYSGGAGAFISHPATTNTIHTILNLTRTSTSAGANGIGGSIDFNINNSTGAGSVTLANQLISELTTATSGAEVSRLTIKGVNAGSPTTPATIDGNGNATFGTTNSIVGTATNNNAAAGNIGEYVTSQIALGVAVSLATTSTSNVTSISLTAGDWDVSGVVDYAMTTATVTDFKHGISITSATLGGQDMYVQKPFAFAGSSATLGDAVPVTRLSLASTTTVYLVAQATFSGGSIDAYGTIRARRVR